MHLGPKIEERYDMNSKINVQFSGDSHRFGKKVSFNFDDPFILKPRNVNLEYLFLDPRSPLAPYSEMMGLSFNTTINPMNEWVGECENLSKFSISETELNIHKLIYLKLAGKFLATATLLGINDLHHENILLINKDGNYCLVPIDLEVLHYRLVSGAETALIPSVKTSITTCGFHSLLRHIDDSTVAVFLDSFIDSWLKLNSNLTQINNIINQFLKTTPIRMIFRPTKKYAEYLRNQNSNIFQDEQLQLTIEEIDQLTQLDIPYFFSKFNTPENLSYFSSESMISESRNLKNHPSFSRHLKQFSQYPVPNDLNTLFFNTFAHIIIHFGPKINSSKKIQSDHFKIEYNETVIKFEVLNQIVNLKI